MRPFEGEYTYIYIYTYHNHHESHDFLWPYVCVWSFFGWDLMILGVDFIHDNDTKGDGHKFLLGMKRTLPVPFCLIRIKGDPLFHTVLHGQDFLRATEHQVLNGAFNGKVLPITFLGQMVLKNISRVTISGVRHPTFPEHKNAEFLHWRIYLPKTNIAPEKLPSQ